MSRRSMFFSYAVVFALAAGWSGCGSAPDVAAPADPGSSRAAEPGGPAGHGDHASGDHPGAEVADAQAQLSPEDRAAAEKQRICPVSEAALGSMGKPLKVRVKGRDVFLCCQGCEPAIMAEPDKYLAKLDQ
jgi:hypothetical protein